jgi:hypothetical protein
MKIILNINIRSVLIFDRNLIGGDEVVRSSSFSTCRHDCGRGCHGDVRGEMQSETSFVWRTCMCGVGPCMLVETMRTCMRACKCLSNLELASM